MKLPRLLQRLLARWERTSSRTGRRVLPVRWALAIVVAAGCRGRAVVPTGRVLHDELGRRVELPGRPLARLVSLAPSVTELLFALGAGAKVVGVDKYSDAPAAELAQVARVGSNYDPSAETILGLRPDLVVTSTSANRLETAAVLARFHIPVFGTDTRVLADLPRTVRALGDLLGVPERADALNAEIAAQLAAVRAEVASEPRVRTLVAVWDRPLYVAGRATFVDDLLTVAGGENVAGDASGFVVYPIERILKAAPEVIIVPLHSREEAPLAAWNRWSDVPAVRDHRVLGVDDALVSRPGPRVGEAARRLAALLHAPRQPSGQPSLPR